MVKLTLLSAKGNAARYFPHAGFLALTPIKLEGVVRTRLDDDRKTIQASDIFVAVRCYEARLGRTGVQHTNLLVDHRLQLWSKPPADAYADLGDGDWPFRLVLPPKLTGHSTAHLQEYRVFWRIEAVLNHIPLVGLGHRQVKSHDLPLMRYDEGVSLPPPPAVWASVPAKLPVRYRINTPPFPLGPMDLVPVSLKLAPADPAVRVASVAVAIERRLEFNDLPPKTPSPSDDTSLSSSTHLVNSAAPRAPSKPVTFVVTSTEAADLEPDARGIFAKTLTLQIPSQKSSHHWAVGESMRTALVTLRFFLRVKVTLSHANGALETLELADRELCLVATNESQRRLALSQHAEAVARARASRLPSPPPSPADGDGGTEQTMTSTSLKTKSSSAKAKAPRRPHTSSGTRDRDRDRRRRPRHTGSAPEERSAEDDVRAWEDELERIEARSRWRTVEAGGSPTARRGPSAAGSVSPAPTPTVTVPPERVGEQVRSAPAARSVFVPPPVASPAVEVAEWEEELERIAAASRRRSVEMLGFAERRTRPRIHVAATS